MKFNYLFYTFLLITSIKSFAAEEKSKARGLLEWIFGLEPLTPGNSKLNIVTKSHNESSLSNSMNKYHGDPGSHLKNTTGPDSNSHHYQFHEANLSLNENADRNEPRNDTHMKKKQIDSHSLSQDSESLQGSSKKTKRNAVDQMDFRYPKQLLPHHHQQLMYEQALLAQMQMAQAQQQQQSFRRPYIEDYDDFYDSSSEEDYRFPGGGVPYGVGGFPGGFRTNLHNDSDLQSSDSQSSDDHEDKNAHNENLSEKAEQDSSDPKENPGSDDPKGNSESHGPKENPHENVKHESSDDQDDPNEDVEHVEDSVGAGGQHSLEHDEGDPEHFNHEPVEAHKEEENKPSQDEEEEESDAEDAEMEYRVRRALHREGRQAMDTTTTSTTSTTTASTTTPYYTTKKGYYKKTTKNAYYKTTKKSYKKTTTAYPNPYNTTKKGGYGKTTTKGYGGGGYKTTTKKYGGGGYKTTTKSYYPTKKTTKAYPTKYTKATTTKKPYYTTTAPAPTCRCGLQSIRGENVNSYTAIRVRVNPWLVAISSGGSHLCSGFIINNKYILTAASCVKGVSKSSLTVTSGWQSNTPINHTVLNVKTHPKYDSSTMANNIAILKISGLTLNQKMRPICLPTEKSTATVANLLTWINTDNKLQMLSTEVPIISDAKCQKLLDKAGSGITIPANTICTGPPGQKTCIGDIGGPLQIYRGGYSYQAIGLVSQTIGCRGTYTPGVYTDLFPYIKWIKNQSKGAQWCSVPSSSSDGYGPSPPSPPSPY